MRSSRRSMLLILGMSRGWLSVQDQFGFDSMWWWCLPLLIVSVFLAVYAVYEER